MKSTAILHWSTVKPIYEITDSQIGVFFPKTPCFLRAFQTPMTVFTCCKLELESLGLLDKRT